MGRSIGLLAIAAVAMLLISHALAVALAGSAVSANAQAGVSVTDQPFQPLFTAELSPDNRRAWTAVAFLRLEGGGYKPYLIVSGVPYFNSRVFNLETGELVKTLTRGGWLAVQYSGTSIALLSYGAAGVVATVDTVQLRAEGWFDTSSSTVEERSGYIAVYSIYLPYITSGVVNAELHAFSAGDGGSLSKSVEAGVRDDCGVRLQRKSIVYPLTGSPDFAKMLMAAVTEDGRLFIGVVNMDSGVFDYCTAVDLGSESEATAAATAFNPGTVDAAARMYAHAYWPYVAGFDLNDEFYVYKYGSGVSVVSDPPFIGSRDFVAVRLVEDSGGGVHVAVYTKDSGGTPELVFLDPDSLQVEATVRLDGYTATYPVMDTGYYAGSPAVYLAVDGYVVVVSVDEMDVVYALPLQRGSIVAALDFNVGTAGQTLMARTYNATEDAWYVEVYAHATSVAGTRVSLALSSGEAVVGGSVEATVRLTLLSGQPLEGRVVHLQELVGGEWVTIASGVTGQDGTASFTVPVQSRGVHYYRAYYGGGQGEAPSWSGARQLTAILQVNVDVDVVASWPETLPLPVTVTVTDAQTGSPRQGLWVTVYANFTWGPGVLGSAVTDYTGKAVVSVRLPAGTYRLWATVEDPYTAIAGSGEALVKVARPGPPAPEGPYVAPVGRVVGPGVALAEPGLEARVVYAFYYGDLPTAPDAYEVTVYPEAPYSVEEAGDGVYIVAVTPQEPGVYTIVFRADYYQSSYLASTTLLAVNVTGQLEAWGASIGGVLEDLLQLRSVLEEYLSDINETLARANITQLAEDIAYIRGVIGEVDGNLVLALDYLAAINSSMIQALQALGEVRTVTLSNGETLALIAGGLEQVKAVLDSLNATIAGVAEGVALIRTDVGTIAARISDIAVDVQAIRGDVVAIKTIAGTIQANLTDLAEALREGVASVADALEGLNGTVSAVLLEVRDGKAVLLQLRDGQALVSQALLEDLKPRLAAVGDKVALLETRIGLVAGNITEVRKALEQAGDKADQALQKLDELSKKLDQLAQQLQEVKQGVEAKAEPASDTTARALGGLGAAAGVAAIALLLTRRP